MAYLMRLLHPKVPGVPLWLESFDVETEHVIFTADPADALEFPDFEAVEAAWRSKIPGTSFAALDPFELAAQEIQGALREEIRARRLGRRHER